MRWKLLKKNNKLSSKLVCVTFYHWIWKKSLKELIYVNTGKYMKNKNYMVNSLLKLKKIKCRRGENNVFKCTWGRRRCWGKEKKLYMGFASAAQYCESTHTGRRKRGDFKNYFPTKKLYNPEMQTLKLLHLFLPLFHRPLGSDLTNTSCFLAALFFIFFHCSCKICNSKVIEALHFERRGGGEDGNPFALKPCAPEDVILVPRWPIS